MDAGRAAADYHPAGGIQSVMAVAKDRSMSGGACAALHREESPAEQLEINDL
jgi:hypothetical protein